MTSPRPTSPFPWPLALGVAFMLVGAAWGAAQLLQAGQPDWAAALRTGSLVNLVGAVTGLLPAWILHRRKVAGGAAYGFVGGMLVRLGLVITLFALVRPEGLTDQKAWPVSVMGLYLVFLFAEVAVIGRWLTRLPTDFPTAAPTAPVAGPAPEIAK